VKIVNVLIGAVMSVGFCLPAQVPPLPEGAQTGWRIGETDEIAVQLLFDTSAAADRLPDGLRFVTLADVASKFPPAQEHLTAHPEHAEYGVSFLEIAAQNLFSIDGREPQWPKNGAIAIWLARVTSTKKDERVRGEEHLSLLIVVPDQAYVEYMKSKGHYAEYGDVTLRHDESGLRHGTIRTASLQVDAACTPTSDLKTGGPSYQTIYQPRDTVKTFLILAYNRNRDGECKGNWKISGENPLSKAVTVGAPVYACCGEFVGGAYKVADMKE
jgi:hypothetical protein